MKLPTPPLNCIFRLPLHSVYVHSDDVIIAFIVVVLNTNADAETLMRLLFIPHDVYLSDIKRHHMTQFPRMS